MGFDKDILIGKYLSGNITSAEEKELTDWLNSNPQNRTEFEEFEKLWKHSLNLKKDRDENVDEAWLDLKSRAIVYQLPKENKNNKTILRIAAAIALIVALSVIVKYTVFNGSSVQQSLQAEKTKEQIKEVALITQSTADSAIVFYLPDSTIVNLNVNSTLTYNENYGEDFRIVRLDGEGYFEIKNNPSPFILYCQGTKITDKGTSFNVKGYKDDKNVEVVVLSGRVEVSGGDTVNSGPLILAANEKGTFNKENDSFTKSKNTEKNFGWWKKKRKVIGKKIKDIINKIRNKK